MVEVIIEGVDFKNKVNNQYYWKEVNLFILDAWKSVVSNSRLGLYCSNYRLFCM